MSISSISSSAVGTVTSGGFDLNKAASAIASRMMSDLDPNNTGKVSKDQFISGLTSAGVSSADATKIYNSIDTSGNGSITKSDIVTAVKNGSLKLAPRAASNTSGSSNASAPGGAGGIGGAGRAGGAGGAGGGGGAGGAGGAQSSSSSSSTATEIATLKKEIAADEKQLQQEKNSAVANQLETTIATLNGELAQAELGQNVNTSA